MRLRVLFSVPVSSVLHLVAAVFDHPCEFDCGTFALVLLLPFFSSTCKRQWLNHLLLLPLQQLLLQQLLLRQLPLQRLPLQPLVLRQIQLSYPRLSLARKGKISPHGLLTSRIVLLLTAGRTHRIVTCCSFGYKAQLYNLCLVCLTWPIKLSNSSQHT